MTATVLLKTLRRRWVSALLGVVVVLAASFGALKIQKPVYQASATLGLVPTSATSGSSTGTGGSSVDNSVLLFGQTAAILPVYTEAATAPDTVRLARQHLPAGMALASVSVATFTSAPNILRLTTNSTSPQAAQASAQAYVEALQSRASSGDIGVASLMSLQELGSPTLPTTPVSPHVKLTLAVGLFLALLAGIAAAWLRETLGGKLESADAVRAAVSLPIFAEIPETRRVPAVHNVDAWLNDDRLRFVNEAMRDLGLTLQLTQFEADSVLVTSPDGRHGKTTVSFGIAVALARSGVQTLLVDADLRRGRVEEMFADDHAHPITKGPGLVDVLRGMPLEAAVQQTSLANLAVLTSGALQDDPSELLDIAFPQALRDMERDWAVVLDATPLVPISDARVMAKFAGSTVIVLAAGTATRGQLRRAVDRLRIIGVAPTAIILNRVKHKRTSSYDRYLPARGTGGRAHRRESPQVTQPVSREERQHPGDGPTAPATPAAPTAPVAAEAAAGDVAHRS